MKTTLWISALALSASLVACDEVKQSASQQMEEAKESARQKMNAGAEQIAEGVKEMAGQAKIEAADHLQKLKEDGAKALDDAAKAAQEAADKMKDSPAPQ